MADLYFSGNPTQLLLMAITQRSRILKSVASCLILLLIGSVYWFLVRSPDYLPPLPKNEPVHLGKKVTAWMSSVDEANETDPAIQALIAMGRPAVPYLVRAALWRPSP